MIKDSMIYQMDGLGFRKKIYGIIEKDSESKASSLYNYFMIVCIVASLIPLFFKRDCLAFSVLEKTTVVVFIPEEWTDII